MDEQKHPTSLAGKLQSTEQKSSYDAACKRLLSEKVVLAQIMKSYLKEYQDCSVEEIANRYIEGMPEVSVIPVHPDRTNPVITGMDTSDKSVNEGGVTFDILYRALVPHTNERIGLIINIEAQKDYYPGYPIVKRGIYYSARLLSSQNERDFTDSQYGKIKKVYSIWICTNPPVKKRNTVTAYEIHPHPIVGHAIDPVSHYDLMSVIIVCLGGPGTENYNGTQRMLDVLLSDIKSAAEKAEILQNDYGIQMTQSMKKEAAQMCNLSEAIEERGIHKGIQQGIQEESLRSIQTVMKNAHLSSEQAMALLEIPESDRSKYLELLKQPQ